MTRADLLTKLARRTNKNTTLDTATQNRLIDFLNERNRRILSLPGCDRLLQATASADSVASRAHIAVRHAMKIHRVYEATNDRYLAPMSLDEYRTLTPDPASATGTPTHFVLVGLQSVARQPTSAELVATSSSAADTTQTVTVEGMLASGGYRISRTVTLNGTTEVSLSASATTWTQVDRWYLSAACAGTITLAMNTTPNTDIADIIAGETESRYQWIYLWPTPTSAITYSIDITRAVTDLSTTVSTDSVDLPDEWHDLVLLGALADEYQHMADSRYEVARQEYKEREQQFRYWLATNGGQTAGTMAKPPSTLGAWYPAGT